MEVKKLFTETFNIQLAQSLPMKDAYFTADLASRGLFTGNLKEEVNEQGTRAQRAKFFIEKTAETGNTESFLQLLGAMEKYSSALKDLAQNIKSRFPPSSPKQPKKRERTPSESDSDDESPQKKRSHYAGNEARITEGKGNDYVEEDIREQVKRAICKIKGPGLGSGTGFIGYVKLSDQSPHVHVMMTNHHVFKDEQVAEDSSVEFRFAEGDKISKIEIPLAELMVKNSFRHSHEDKLDFAMVQIDWAKLMKQVPRIESLDLNNPASVNNGDHITVFQHPLAGGLSSSLSSCAIYKYLLIYSSETAGGSSGGPILKADDGKFKIVGIHRGGLEGHFNVGSKLSDILQSIAGKPYEIMPNADEINKYCKGIGMNWK